MMWHRWSVYLVLSSLLVLAVRLSFAEGGEGTSVGGHYWLLCLVELSVLAKLELCVILVYLGYV